MQDLVKSLIQQHKLKKEAIKPLEKFIRYLELEKRSREDAVGLSLRAKDYVTDFNGDGSAFEDDMAHARFQQEQYKSQFINAHVFKKPAASLINGLEVKIRRALDLPLPSSQEVGRE